MGGRGRGRGGGGGSAAVRAVASALGIARHEMSSFVAPIRTEAPPTFPPLTRSVIPLQVDTSVGYMADSKSEIITLGFQESPYYLAEKKEQDIKRYTDKYLEFGKPKLEPDWSRLPEELCWQKKSVERSQAKRRKVEDAMTAIVAEKLEKLEERDGAAEETEEKEEDSDAESEKAADEAVSDDDYLEEDNDYAQGYFDNGEAYGDAGSDDNMDGDEF